MLHVLGEDIPQVRPRRKQGLIEKLGKLRSLAAIENQLEILSDEDHLDL
jgi:hypothetical protein